MVCKIIEFTIMLEIIPLCALVFVGSVLQAITGFGVGLVVVSGCILLGLLSMEDATLVAMTLSLFSTGFAVGSRLKPTLQYPKVIPYIITFLAFTIVGTMALYYAADYPLYYRILHLIFGMMVICAAISLVRNLQGNQQESSPSAFYGCFGISGLLGGVFMTSGPTMSYLMYQQPWDIQRIRNTILATFLFGTFVRMLWVLVEGEPIEKILFYALLAPISYLGVRVAKRYLGNLNVSTVKKTVCVVVLLTGINICAREISYFINL